MEVCGEKSKLLWLRRVCNQDGCDRIIFTAYIAPAGPRPLCPFGYPLAVIEFALNANVGSRRTQVQAYAADLASSMHTAAQNCLVAAELYLFDDQDEAKRKDWLVINCAGFAHEKTIQFSHFWEGPFNVQAFARLLYVMQRVAN